MQCNDAASDVNHDCINSQDHYWCSKNIPFTLKCFQFFDLICTCIVKIVTFISISDDFKLTKIYIDISFVYFMQQ